MVFVSDESYVLHRPASDSIFQIEYVGVFSEYVASVAICRA